MNSEPSRLALLRDAEEFLSRPLQCPGKPLGHEDVPRQKDGLPELPVLGFTPECDVSSKHLGCPHILGKLGYAGDIVRLVAPAIYNAQFEQEIKETLAWLRTPAQSIDEAARYARLGTTASSITHVKPENIPSAMQAEENMRNVAANFAEFCRNQVEPFRKKLLGLVQEAIQAEEALACA